MFRNASLQKKMIGAFAVVAALSAAEEAIPMDDMGPF